MQGNDWTLGWLLWASFNRCRSLNNIRWRSQKLIIILYSKHFHKWRCECCSGEHEVPAFRVTCFAPSWWLPETPELVHPVTNFFALPQADKSRDCTWLFNAGKSREHLLVSFTAHFHWLVCPALMFNSWPGLVLGKLEMAQEISYIWNTGGTNERTNWKCIS